MGVQVPPRAPTMTTNHPVYTRLLDRQSQLGHSVCLGLDPVLSQIPAAYPQTMAGVTQFLERLIDDSLPHVVAYKPNIAFFEALGLDGLRVLEAVIKRINQQVPVILDAKRGDIGTTATQQARYLIDYFGADATTLHPYMGHDSIEPFLAYRDQYHFVLVLTSNPGAQDIEQQVLANGRRVYEHVLDLCSQWHSVYGNVGCVVGATQPDVAALRQRDPQLVYLMPGVGAQGGSYAQTQQAGKNGDGLVVIPVSRALMMGSGDSSFESRLTHVLSQ